MASIMAAPCRAAAPFTRVQLSITAGPGSRTSPAARHRLIASTAARNRIGMTVAL